jgi:hypothetical protein
MLRRVALLITDVSEEVSSSFIKVTRIGELGTTLAVTADARCEEIQSLRNVRQLLVVSSSAMPVTLIEGGAKFHRNVGCFKSHMA